MVRYMFKHCRWKYNINMLFTLIIGAGRDRKGTL